MEAQTIGSCRVGVIVKGDSTTIKVTSEHQSVWMGKSKKWNETEKTIKEHCAETSFNYRKQVDSDIF